MDARTDAARYHVHGQKKPDDAGKPGAWKARTPGLEGAGQKKEQQCHLRWLATLPRSRRRQKRKRRDGLIALAQRMGRAVGYVDEVWWSRVAQPNMHAWSEVKQPLRLLELQVSKEDPDPKALSCQGILDTPSGQVRLRLVDGRPVSQVTADFLEWLCQQSAAQGQRTLVLIWDNASWHVSKHVKSWLRQHNQAARQAQREGKQGVRAIPCWLPTKSPWLNRIEPHWVHGKRAIVEPARLLTAQEVIQQVCSYFGCEQVASLTQQAA